MGPFLIPHTITSKSILDAVEEKQGACVIGWSLGGGHANCDNISGTDCSADRCIFIERNFSKEIFKEHVIDTGLISKGDVLELALEHSELV